jgi:hypothetical protein
MNNNTTPKPTKTTYGTWLGIKGGMWEYLATSNRTGERVIAHRWIEDNPNTGNSANDLVLRHVTGDATKGTLRVLSTDVVIPNGTVEDANTYASRHLA